MTIAYLDDTFVPLEEAKVSATDRGFLYGDGAFVTMLVEEGEPHHLSTHLTRLVKQAKELGITPPPIPADLVYETLAQNHAQTGTWALKIILTGGSSPVRTLHPRAHGHLLITCTPYTPPPYAPLHLVLFPAPHHLCHAHFKSLANLNRLYVAEYARAQGADDAVTTTADGTLLEASYGNLFWVHDGALYTPAPTLPLNFGVTLTHLIQTWDGPIHHTHTTLSALPHAPLFRTNSLTGIRPITHLQKKRFPRDFSLENRFTQASPTSV